MTDMTSRFVVSMLVGGLRIGIFDAETEKANKLSVKKLWLGKILKPRPGQKIYLIK